MSQRSDIRAALERGESLTREDVRQRWGCAKAPARIAELRQEGMDIETVTEERREVVDGKVKYRSWARWRLREGPLTLFKEEV